MNEPITIDTIIAPPLKEFTISSSEASTVIYTATATPLLEANKLALFNSTVTCDGAKGETIKFKGKTVNGIVGSYHLSNTVYA